MKPILFSTNMVRKILKGEKTQTRRVIGVKKPYKVGEILWVRETWQNICACPEQYRCACPEQYAYKADGEFVPYSWKPSIHMPKAAARIFLEVLSVDIEQLQDITQEDCEAEGIPSTNGRKMGEPFWNAFCISNFSTLWDSINAKRGYSWNSNPRVYKYTFRVVDKPQESEEKSRR